MVDEVPDLPDAITAYRVWRRHQTGLLESAAFPHQWAPGVEQVATCFGSLGSTLESGCGGPPSRDARGHQGYGCGIYGYKTLEDMLAERGASCDARFFVFGEVLLWGKVRPHERGWRASNACVNRIYLMPDADADNHFDREVLGLVYDVPVVPLPEFNRETVENLRGASRVGIGAAPPSPARRLVRTAAAAVLAGGAVLCAVRAVRLFTASALTDRLLGAPLFVVASWGYLSMSRWIFNRRK